LCAQAPAPSAREAGFDGAQISAVTLGRRVGADEQRAQAGLREQVTLDLESQALEFRVICERQDPNVPTPAEPSLSRIAHIALQ
jgi:hypothetical protein